MKLASNLPLGVLPVVLSPVLHFSIQIPNGGKISGGTSRSSHEHPDFVRFLASPYSDGELGLLPASDSFVVLSSLSLPKMSRDQRALTNGDL